MPRTTVRRSLAGFASAGLLLGGTVGFVAAASSAGAAEPLPANAIALSNDTAGAKGDGCPQHGHAHWFFWFNPYGGGATMDSVTLDLTSETLTFSGAQLVPTADGPGTAFVQVPDGHALGDLKASGSYATWSGAQPEELLLMAVCKGHIPTTTTTRPKTTTTTVPETTTTTVPETTTTTVPETTTTTVPETTTTTVPETTTTTVPETTTTTVPETTTTTVPETTTTTVPETTTTTVPDSTTTTVPDTTTTLPETTTTTAEVLGTVQTPTTLAEVAGAVQTQGNLPYTGTDTTGMVAAGLAVLLGGGMLVGLARTKGRPAQK